MGTRAIEIRRSAGSGVLSPFVEDCGREVTRLSSANLLETTVVELGVIMQRSGLDRTLAIGELVLNRFFDGIDELWRARRRNKRNSVRRLAEHPECPLSRSALNQAIAVHVAVRDLPEIRQLPHIGPSHIAATLGLPPEAQHRWLESAAAECWSVRQLRSKVVGARRVAGERRGRPATSDADRALAALDALLRRFDGAVSRVRDELPLAGAHDRERILDKVVHTEQCLGDFRRSLSTLGPAAAR